MHRQLLTLAAAALLLIQTGCATGFRAGGPNGGGVEAGVAIGSPNPEPAVYPPAGR